MAHKLAPLAKLQPARNLTEEAVLRIGADIRSGRLLPGTRLPTEQEMMAALGVSRSVVREAVAALRAEGLVVTRQGSGAFVAAAAAARPFRIDHQELRSIERVINVMELRMAIEVEAAALAGERATRPQVVAIGGALKRIDEALERGEGAVREDFAFHRAIAQATGNEQYSRFLEFLGSHVIPRQSVRTEISTPTQQRQYLQRIQKEHQRIFDAIAAHDPAGARQAMRHHLVGSLQRYRALAKHQAQ